MSYNSVTKSITNNALRVMSSTKHKVINPMIVFATSLNQR